MSEDLGRKPALVCADGGNSDGHACGDAKTASINNIVLSDDPARYASSAWDGTATSSNLGYIDAGAQR